MEFSVVGQDLKATWWHFLGPDVLRVRLQASPLRCLGWISLVTHVWHVTTTSRHVVCGFIFMLFKAV